MRSSTILFVLCLSSYFACAQRTQAEIKTVDVSEGWTKNSVNAVVFRRNSLVTHGNQQYIAFYNPEGNMVIGKRKLGADRWELRVSQYKGNVRDAHNSISIMTDADGYLHVSWDHHNQALNYCKSIAPGSLDLTEKLQMTGLKENKVTYPEFYKTPEGNVIFLFRDGSSGNGNLMLNYYQASSKKWTRLQDGLINGEGKRNAYWQMTIDKRGIFHLSWVWRSSGDVATNHNMCYARSLDGGKTWEKSTGEKYSLPINAANAEYACLIPEKSDLINTTSMTADKKGNPYIVSYWRDTRSGIPQYHLIYTKNGEWKTAVISQRTLDFSLSGGGTKSIPISRPQILIDEKGGKIKAMVVYRDLERGAKVSMAINENLNKSKAWAVHDLTTQTVDAWEPSYDTALWAQKQQLHLFVQKVAQGDGEKTKDVPDTMVQVLEYGK